MEIKTLEEWHTGDHGNLSEYLKPGDAVDEEMMYYFLEVLPPACFDSRIVQIGEPNDHRGPDGAPRFSTVIKSEGVWYYAGHQPNARRFGMPKLPGE